MTDGGVGEFVRQLHTHCTHTHIQRTYTAGRTASIDTCSGHPPCQRPSAPSLSLLPCPCQPAPSSTPAVPLSYFLLHNRGAKAPTRTRQLQS